MPHTYELTLGSSVKEDEEIELVAWLDDAWNSIVPKDTPYAIARGKRGLGKLYTNGEVYLLTKMASLGEAINKDTVIVRGAADGEQLPEEKPYTVFKYD